MTICISAIGKEKGSEFIVFSTDHMVSVPLGQFEQVIEKFKIINPNTIAMFSGNALLFQKIINNLDANVQSLEYNDVLDKAHKKMKALRFEIFEKEILGLYGIDFNYIRDVLNKPVPNQFVDNILKALSTFNLQSSLMLIGFQNANAQISILDEFRGYNFRDMNFGSIGSGQPQASNTLMFQKHSKNETLTTTLYNVYKAKRNAEVSVGVGRETDLYVFFDGGKLIKVDDSQLSVLNDVYQKELIYGKSNKSVNSLAVDIYGKRKGTT
jgi:20S proteasome alpha/beta subunit